MIKDSQFKKLKKVFDRAQNENSKLKKEKLKELNELIEGTPEYQKLSSEIDQIGTISDGTKETYSDTVKAVLREAERQFGITEFKNLKPEHTEKILQDKIINGERASTIRKTSHALDYFQRHASATRVFKEKVVVVTDHQKNLKMFKAEKVIRKSSESHRYRATKEESLAVINEMEKRNPYLASIARYQLLTGFRISEALRQAANNIDIENGKHFSSKAKGGLDNLVYTNHQTSEDKVFLSKLIGGADAETNRIFHREKDDEGNYKSDNQIRLAVTRLARRSADKLGIGGVDGHTFSSHSFRGSFANDRMKYYSENWQQIDQIIEDKLREQPRLINKYKNFEKRIKEKVSEEKRDEREIQDYEKIQWLVSTDLNHSRQDITRYYVSTSEIKSELSKYH